MNKFWQWMRGKEEYDNYNHLFDFGMNENGIGMICHRTDLPKQMFIGYIYEYINYLYKKILQLDEYEYFEDVGIEKNLGMRLKMAFGHKNHYEELKEIIEELEGLLDEK